jgi:sulfoacetaldehyde acetyltransferase
VVTGYLHNDAFPAAHSLALGPVGYGGSKAAMRALSQADVVLAVGTQAIGTLMPRYDFDAFPHDAKLIQIDRNPLQIGRTVPFEVGIVGDAKAALVRLFALVGDGGVRMGADLARVTEQVARSKEEWERELESWSTSDGAEPSPAPTRALPNDVLVVTDIGASSAWRSTSVLAARRHTPRWGYGRRGLGLVGAKLCRPDAGSRADRRWLRGIRHRYAYGAQTFRSSSCTDQPVGAEKRNRWSSIRILCQDQSVN